LANDARRALSVDFALARLGYIASWVAQRAALALTVQSCRWLARLKLVDVTGRDGYTASIGFLSACGEGEEVGAVADRAGAAERSGLVQPSAIRTASDTRAFVQGSASGTREAVVGVGPFAGGTRRGATQACGSSDVGIQASATRVDARQAVGRVLAR